MVVSTDCADMAGADFEDRRGVDSGATGACASIEESKVLDSERGGFGFWRACHG
jgi:hypothetical protein